MMSVTVVNGRRHAPIVTAAEIRKRLMLTPADSGFEPVVEIKDAHVAEAVDLANSHFDVALVMRHCWFEKPVNLAGAKFNFLAMIDGCSAPQLDAEHIVVNGDLRLDTLVCGKVNLRGAHITDDLHIENSEFSAEAPALDVADAEIDGAFLGHKLHTDGLRLEGAHVACKIDLTNASLGEGRRPDRKSLDADGLKADGGIEAGHLEADAQVSLVDLQCTSTLELRGAHLNCKNLNEYALCLDRSHVTGSIYCDNGFTATGAIHAIGVDIGESLYLDGADLNTKIPDGGESLILRHIRCGMKFSATMSGGRRFKAEGRIDLSDAHIGGVAQVAGADLGSGNCSGNDPAITADRACFDADVILRDVKSNAAIRLDSAHIACDLDVEGLSGQAVALELGGATIGKVLRLQRATTKGADKPPCRMVDVCGSKLVIFPVLSAADITDLTGAYAAVLLDDPERYLSAEHRLVLNGFTYGQIHMSGVSLKTRLDWLRAGTREVRTSAGSYDAPPQGFAPQPYEQLAAAYRGLGQMRDARMVLLHKNRARTRGMKWKSKSFPWRILGYFQDISAGYGYLPGHAFFWIVVLWLTGVGYFAANNPKPTSGLDGFTGLDVVQYPMELLLPGIGLGDSSVWTPASGFGKALALILIIAGWLLGVTIVAGIARVLKRD